MKKIIFTLLLAFNASNVALADVSGGEFLKWLEVYDVTPGGGGGGGVESVSGVADEIEVINGASNAVVGLADDLTVPGNIALTLPAGTTSQQDVVDNGIRFNSETGEYELYYPDTPIWAVIESAANGVSSVVGTTHQIDVNTVDSVATVSIANNPTITGTIVTDSITGAFTAAHNSLMGYNNGGIFANIITDGTLSIVDNVIGVTGGSVGNVISDGTAASGQFALYGTDAFQITESPLSFDGTYITSTEAAYKQTGAYTLDISGVSATNASATVTGSGFLNLVAGQNISLDANIYKILLVHTDSSLTLGSNFSGSTGTYTLSYEPPITQYSNVGGTSTPYLVYPNGATYAGGYNYVTTSGGGGTKLDALSTTLANGTSIINQADFFYQNGTIGAVSHNTYLYGGTPGSPTAVADNAILFRQSYFGYDGTSIHSAANMQVVAEGTVSAGVIPTGIKFNLADASGSNFPALHLGNDASITSKNGNQLEDGSSNGLINGNLNVGGNFTMLTENSEIFFTVANVTNYQPQINASDDGTFSYLHATADVLNFLSLNETTFTGGPVVVNSDLLVVGGTSLRSNTVVGPGSANYTLDLQLIGGEATLGLAGFAGPASTPSTNDIAIYYDSGTRLISYVDDSGTVNTLTPGGGGGGGNVTADGDGTPGILPRYGSTPFDIVNSSLMDDGTNITLGLNTLIPNGTLISTGVGIVGGSIPTTPASNNAALWYNGDELAFVDDAGTNHVIDVEGEILPLVINDIGNTGYTILPSDLGAVVWASPTSGGGNAMAVPAASSVEEGFYCWVVNDQINPIFLNTIASGDTLHSNIGDDVRFTSTEQNVPRWTKLVLMDKADAIWFADVGANPLVPNRSTTNVTANVQTYDNGGIIYTNNTSGDLPVLLPDSTTVYGEDGFSLTVVQSGPDAAIVTPNAIGTDTLLTPYGVVDQLYTEGPGSSITVTLVGTVWVAQFFTSNLPGEELIVNADFTATIDDVNKYIYMDSTSTQNFTLPRGDTLPPGYTIWLVQLNTGAISINTSFVGPDTIITTLTPPYMTQGENLVYKFVLTQQTNGVPGGLKWLLESP